MKFPQTILDMCIKLGGKKINNISSMVRTGSLIGWLPSPGTWRRWTRRGYSFAGYGRTKGGSMLNSCCTQSLGGPQKVYHSNMWQYCSHLHLIIKNITNSCECVCACVHTGRITIGWRNFPFFPTVRRRRLRLGTLWACASNWAIHFGSQLLTR